MNATAPLTRRDALLLDHLWLVKKAVSFYPNASLSRDDMAGYGYAGLLQACEKYEPDPRWKASTWLMWRVRSAIGDAVKSERRRRHWDALAARAEADDRERATPGATDDRDQVMALLALATRRQRRLLALVYGLDGGVAMTPIEAARALGITSQAAYQAIGRALERIRCGWDDAT